MAKLFFKTDRNVYSTKELGFSGTDIPVCYRNFIILASEVSNSKIKICNFINKSVIFNLDNFYLLKECYMNYKLFSNVEIVGFLIILLMAGCSNNNPETSVILPLNVGNQWIYKVTNPDDSNKVFFDTLSVSKDTLVNKEKWYIITHTWENSFKLILQNQADGLHLIDYYNTPRIFLKYKAVPGEIYSPGKRDDSVKIISVNEKVKTIAGEFECYIYGSPKINIDNKDDHFCMAPGIGCIKTMIYNFKYELVKYNLK